jgi:hypothetical protein
MALGPYRHPIDRVILLRRIRAENTCTCPMIIGNFYYISVNTTLFPAGGVCCLGQHVSAHMCHLQVRFLVTIILSCTWRKFCLTMCESKPVCTSTRVRVRQPADFRSELSDTILLNWSIQASVPLLARAEILINWFTVHDTCISTSEWYQHSQNINNELKQMATHVFMTYYIILHEVRTCERSTVRCYGNPQQRN